MATPSLPRAAAKEAARRALEEEEEQEKVHTYSDDGGKDHLRFSAMERDERTQTLVGFTGERDYEIAP